MTHDTPFDTAMLKVLLHISLGCCAAAASAPGADYIVRGAFEVDTNENTQFLWRGALYLLENIPCYSSEHASRWDPAYANASYARIRRWDTGAIVLNVSSSIGYGFLTAFVDEPAGGGAEDAAAPRVWLFGSANNRCQQHGPQHEPAQHVQYWRLRDPASGELLGWDTGSLYGGGLPFGTQNVQVSKVESGAAAQAAAGLPAHTHVMILEHKPNLFALNNAPGDGDLTRGWFAVPGVNNDFGAPAGGPSIRWNPLDGMYYIIEGGRTVELVRTADFKTWERSPNRPFVAPSVGDAQVAPFAGFPATAAALLFPPMAAHRSAWDWNSNDADVCCMNSGANESYVLWGAGTQGRAPGPPLTKANHCANVIGTANKSLPQLLADHFVKRS